MGGSAGGGTRPLSANGYSRSSNVGSAFSNGGAAAGGRKEAEEDRRRSTMGFGAVGSGESAIVGGAGRRPDSVSPFLSSPRAGC